MRRNLNLLATFLISGLWHGDNWTFLAWGGIHGIWNMCSRKREGEAGPLRKIGQTILTFLGVTAAWVFFRAESLGAAVAFIRHAVLHFSLSYGDIQNSILPFTGDNTCAAYFLTACLFLLLLFLYEWGQTYGKGACRKGEGPYGKGFSLSALWMALMGISVLLFGVFGVSGFLYAQF